ncbi:hypothetical protein NDU88_007904 [Pleurodeles waltl]|uniref:Uncharacterized protein n=1 Tax=Pleurodeles waltl TaxID=8319 RepID=A0AAV7RSA1_PLEWA|nr:hypothetical protein NDU88_007904 [Pleurodeles waltl]
MGTPSSLGGHPQLGLPGLPCPMFQVLPRFATVGAPPVIDPQGLHLLGDGMPYAILLMGADLQRQYRQENTIRQTVQPVTQMAHYTRLQHYWHTHSPGLNVYTAKKTSLPTYTMPSHTSPYKHATCIVPTVYSSVGLEAHTAVRTEEEETGDGPGAAVNPVFSKDEEAEDEGNRTTVIRQYFQ